MKKSTLIICTVLTTFSFTAFSFSNWDSKEKTEKITQCSGSNEANVPPSFSYDVDSRFVATVTRKELANAKTVFDIVPKNSNWENLNFREVNIRELDEEENNKYINGISKVLSQDQINLLKTFDYSTNFVIDAFVNSKNPSPRDHHPYYITVVPEKEASYMGGKQIFIKYLKDNCASTITKTNKGNLKPGKIHFTISQGGRIKNVNLESTSGYPSVDQKMIELISTIPGIWIPATNENGETVKQELVFSFGAIGC